MIRTLPAGRFCLALVVALGVLLSGLALGKDDKKKPVPPPTRRTQVIRAETYKKMDEAQKAFEAKKYADAQSALDALKGHQDKLNDYERATLYGLYAALYYAEDQPRKAIASYEEVLKQPNLQEGLRDNSMYAMAQLYFIVEDYRAAIATVKKWMTLVSQPSPEGYALLAQGYYQTQKYADAEASLITSLKISKEQGQQPKESALALLRAIYYSRKEYAKAAKVLEILVAQHPDNGSYWQQLAGMRGLMDQQRDQLTTLHAAYGAGLLKSGQDLLNYARLCMVQDIPYVAVRILSRALKQKLVETNEDNLQLLAQALALSRESKQEIPVLTRLAEGSGESKYFVYLGQAYTDVGDWDGAVKAYKSALTAKDVARPADIHVQLGMALYNENKFADARTHFVEAANSSHSADMAGNWIKFLDNEIARRDAVRRLVNS